MSNLPIHTVKIFETLGKGGFISSNSSKSDTRELYDIIDTNFETLLDYFDAINFKLERGNEYFYFSRNETKVEVERKLDSAYKWIDIYDFFKAVNPSFGPGAKLSPSHIAEQCKVNSELKMKLESMRKLTGEDNIVARIKKLIEILRKDEFVELESELLDNWKVLSSIHYIENFISLINIPEENEAS